MKRVNYINNVEDIDYFCFCPTILKLYDNCYERVNEPNYVHRIIHKIRMIIQQLMGGYKVYYMYIDKKVVGHLVVAPGGSRLPQSSRKDIVIGPIWISPDQRGKGLGTKGIAAVLNNLNIPYEYAYEYIATDNIASIRSVEKNNFELLGFAKETGLLRKISLSENGESLNYRKRNSNYKG